MQVDTEPSLSPQACLVYYGSIGFRVVLEEHVVRGACCLCDKPGLSSRSHANSARALIIC